MKVWSYWEGPMPDYISLCAELLGMHNPSLEIVTDDTLALHGIDPESVAWIQHPQRSDVIRTELLARHGGMWSDLDCIPMRDFGLVLDAARTSPAGFASYHSTDRTIGYGFTAARADSPIIQAQAAHVRAIVAARRKPGWLEVSTEPLTPIARAHKGECALWPFYLVHPVSWSEMARMEKRGTDNQHAAHVAANPSAFCYMLSNQGIGPEIRRLSRAELLESDRFISFLFRESFRRAAAVRVQGTGRAVVVLNLHGDGMEASARDSMKAAAARWGAEYVEITRGLFGWKDPLWEKLNLDRHCRKFARVVTFDRDVVVREDCPNLFDLVSETHIGAVPSEQPGHNLLGAIQPPMDALSRKVGVSLDYGKEYFNSGVLVFGPGAHAKVFDAARYVSMLTDDRRWQVYDQGCLSVARKWTDAPLHVLPNSLNRCGAELWDRWTPQQRDHVWHFCGAKNGHRIRATNWRLPPARQVRVIGYRTTENIGDAMQTLALARLLGGSATECIDRAEANSMPADRPLVLNGYLNGPIPSSRNVVVAGVFLAHHRNEYADWFKGVPGKVGARDPWTAEFLKARGVDAEFIGCATLTLPRSTAPRSGALYIDVKHPHAIGQKVNADWERQWRLASQRIDLLARAEIVYTSRLHVALTCLAVGTPVVVEREHRDKAWKPERFTLLDALGFTYGEPCVMDVSAFASRFVAFLGEALGSIAIVDNPPLPAMVVSPSTQKTAKKSEPAPGCGSCTGPNLPRAARRGEPSTWGPAKWQEFHVRPYTARKLDKEDKWLGKFTATIPCPDCREHFGSIISAFPPDITDRDAYFRWTWAVHNQVNERLGRAIFDFEQAYKQRHAVREVRNARADLCRECEHFISANSKCRLTPNLKSHLALAEATCPDRRW